MVEQMKIKIDHSVQDAIIKAVLKEHIKILKKSIKALSAKTKLAPYEEVDLLHNISMLNSMKEVHNFFALPEEQV